MVGSLVSSIFGLGVTHDSPWGLKPGGSFACLSAMIPRINSGARPGFVFTIKDVHCTKE